MCPFLSPSICTCDTTLVVLKEAFLCAPPYLNVSRILDKAFYEDCSIAKGSLRFRCGPLK